MNRFAARPLLVGGVLLLAIVVVVVIAERMMGAPRGDVEQLALFLAAGGIGSLLVGAAAVNWASRRLSSLRSRLTTVNACVVSAGEPVGFSIVDLEIVPSRSIVNRTTPRHPSRDGIHPRRPGVSVWPQLLRIRWIIVTR